MISAQVLADSIGPNGVRITTFVLKYPRFAHAELMTHRVFSRNASSSRAIPVRTQISMVEENPVIPMAFTRNKPGMQGGEKLTGADHDQAVQVWLDGCLEAIKIAHKLSGLEVHKQYANRVLEPYAHITIILTGTDFDNFYALRWHEAALPEMQDLAEKMWRAQEASAPRELQPGMMHLPFVSEKEYLEVLTKVPTGMLSQFDEGLEANRFDLLRVWGPLVKRSVARCARVSYMKHDGTQSTPAEDDALYDRLLGSNPIHASPAEHQAFCRPQRESRYSGNLRGWLQYRKMLWNENVTEFNAEAPNAGQKTDS